MSLKQKTINFVSAYLAAYFKILSSFYMAYFALFYCMRIQALMITMIMIITFKKSSGKNVKEAVKND